MSRVFEIFEPFNPLPVGTVHEPNTSTANARDIRRRLIDREGWPANIDVRERR